MKIGLPQRYKREIRLLCVTLLGCYLLVSGCETPEVSTHDDRVVADASEHDTEHPKDELRETDACDMPVRFDTVARDHTTTHDETSVVPDTVARDTVVPDTVARDTVARDTVACDMIYETSVVPDTVTTETIVSDTKEPDISGPDTADAGGDRGADVIPPTPPATTPVTLTTTYFRADATTVRGGSGWGTASYPTTLPNNMRSTIFWGRFLGGGCATPGYGKTVLHPLTLPGATVFRAAYPDCAGAYGPSVEADIFAFGAPQHLLRSEVRPRGAFQTFGSAGQNASGANKYIHAAYVDFRPTWRPNVPKRMRPWGGPSTAPSRIRFAMRIKESVTREVLDSPSTQQLQQVVRMLVINEQCTPASSSSYCQIEFNFKTYNRGVGAYTSFTKGNVFNDLGQGGLIAVVGPIAKNGSSTQIKGVSAWTSWGSATQLTSFRNKTFQVEMSWLQFQDLLRKVSNGNPAAVYGPAWSNRNAWSLSAIGYGQENYNPSSTASSLIEGMFESIEVFAL